MTDLFAGAALAASAGKGSGVCLPFLDLLFVLDVAPLPAWLICPFWERYGNASRSLLDGDDLPMTVVENK